MNTPLLEQLAELEHQQWAAWTLHFLDHQTPDNLERWKRQLALAYHDLSESEKEADREWARKVLDLVEKQKESAVDVPYEGKFLRLKRAGRWEYVERTKVSGIVAILAFTGNQELLLVEQHRVPVNRRVIEIPAGLAGDIEGEELEALTEAAKRELVEETGYAALEMEFLMEGPSSAGLTNEVISFFRATGLKKISNGGGDGTENILVHTVPLRELDAWLQTKREEGCLVDYKIHAALYFVRPPVTIE